MRTENLSRREKRVMMKVRIKKLDERGCKIEIRYPYVPGVNSDECEKIGEFLAKLRNTKRIKVLGYHSFAKSKYEAMAKKNTLSVHNATRDEVQGAVDILASYGLCAINGMEE